jgi:hypothetical protein
MMPWEEQLEQLRKAYPSAVVRSHGDREWSGHLVTIPHFRLRKTGTRNRWDRDEVTIHFVVPAGFPGAQPDSFWADPDLKLVGGGGTYRMETPKGADWRVFPEVTPPGWKKEGGFGRFFRLHLQAFNPNHDTIYTFAKVIGLRLQTVR